MKKILVIFLLLFLPFISHSEINAPEESHIEWLWGVGELWWYNLADVFSYKCDIDYRKEDSTIFWIEGKGEGFFGVRIPCWKELNKGFRYEFKIACFPQPDMIVLGDKIVWKKGKGKYEDGYVKFIYIPENKHIPYIYIIKNATSDIQRIYLTRNPYYTHRFRLRQSKFYGKPPEYEKFKLPGETNFESINPKISYSSYHKQYFQPVEYKALPLPEVSYPTSKIKVIEAWIKPTRTPKLFSLLKENKVDIVSFDKGSIEQYARILKDIKMDICVPPLLMVPGREGVYQHCHWITPVSQNKVEEAKKTTIEALKKYLKIYPESKIYLFCPEFNSIYGMWGGGIIYSPMRNIPEFKEIIEKGGPEAFKTIFKYFSDIHKEIKEKVGKDKVKIIFQLDRAGCQGAYAVKCGADIVMHKNIHCQNLNIVVANSRGTAFAYDKEYGFDHDCWNRQYVYSYHPDEVKQDLLVYFHSGGGYILDEIPVGSRDKEHLSALGKVWFDFIRYCKLHPERGKQIVKIGIMRGLPDEWNRVGGPGASWETAKDSKEVTFHPYFTDYNLLNIVFSNFGNCYRTYPDRLCTGTPYGPVDFIPWDTLKDKLKNYEVIIYLGKSNCMDKKQYENLKEYVKEGGTLIMAAGQLRKEDGSFYKKDISDLFGCKIKGKFTLKEDPIWDREKQTWIFPEGKKEYILLEVVGEKATVFYRFKNSDPYVIKNRIGKGKTYLFATEYLTEFGEETPTRIIMNELEKVKFISFSPESSWIEYMITKKGDIYIIPVFNHGNVGFPSGNGRKTGPWNGKVIINLDKFKLPKGRIMVYQVDYRPENKIPFKLKPIKSEVKRGNLIFKTTIDKFKEIVIGRKGKVKKQYFYGK